MDELTSRILRHAAELGFDPVGVARADEPLDVDHARYLEFVEAGMHGGMDYLAAHRDVRRRLDTDAILEGARSVICVGLRFARDDAAEARDPPLARMVARYARGQDYHRFMRRRLARLAAFVRSLGEGVRARPLCDTAPVLERAWAARAGLGFVGKNGMLIAPGLGSHLLLGEVVTTLPLTPGTPIGERCGACTRCLDACPTEAFSRPFVLDARRCIAYLTIESREAAPEALRPAMSEHLFGCDVCQEVCPYNRTAPPPAEATRPFRPLARWRDLSLADLVALDDARYRAVVEGSPLRRATREGLARNAATALAGNDAPRAEEVLQEAARGEGMLGEHAAWALGARAAARRDDTARDEDGGEPVTDERATRRAVPA